MFRLVVRKRVVLFLLYFTAVSTFCHSFYNGIYCSEKSKFCSGIERPNRAPIAVRDTGLNASCYCQNFFCQGYTRNCYIFTVRGDNSSQATFIPWAFKPLLAPSEFDQIQGIAVYFFISSVFIYVYLYMYRLCLTILQYVNNIFSILTQIISKEGNLSFYLFN